MQLFNGDCLEKLKELENCSVDSIVTDPPYGLSFMGKHWDYDVPSVAIWKEALRVLKPGGHLLSFGGTRTYHRLVVNIEDAGFDIRDCIQWLYGSGFPKSHNLKEQWQGWGTALKPANEPIVVARKPLEKGLTVADNVLKYGCGAINIDGSRIDYASEADKKSAMPGDSKLASSIYSTNTDGSKDYIQNPHGRWPANIILDEAAAEMLDEQSGVLKTNSGKSVGSKVGAKSIYGSELDGKTYDNLKGDSGGASRFFYVAKASKSERNAGLEGMPEKTPNDGRSSGLSSGMPEKAMATQANFHPTVKPIKLMQYLINLVTPPNGTVLDPFMGSGSAGVAAKNLGFKFVGIELSAEYFEIAKKRIL